MASPVTEASNELSREIDLATPEQIVAILQKCDHQIFSGYQNYTTLFDASVITSIDGVSDSIRQVLKTPDDGLVVFSGAGTSGRLGFMVARTFNELQRSRGAPETFRYLIAGEDKALFTSQEAPEDDPRVGVEALKKVTESKSRVVFIGITCGLSAPYVAGQLEFCMDNPDKFVPVLLGFNPVSLARNIPIENWDKTFLQVARHLESYASVSGRGFILNPVVGPESITGSSRMKGGTATKILLETVCLKTLLNETDKTSEKLSTSDYMKCYQCVFDAVYSRKQTIGEIIQLAGDSLSSNGHLYYYGTDSLAIMAMIDGTECPPTYGATLDDVRGFVEEGFATLQNNNGDMSHLGKHFRIDGTSLKSDIQLTDKDTVVCVCRDGNSAIPENIQQSQCKKVLLTFAQPKASELFDVLLYINIKPDVIDALIGVEARQVAYQLFCEMATKWSMNAVSTGAFILKGKVYQNIMIDVAVSNNKLFHRAVGIVQRLGRVETPEATECLLRSIYDSEGVTDEIRSFPVTKHIYTATPKKLVVPVALIAAVSKSSIADAKIALSRHRVVRSALLEIIGNTP